jgi:translation initiation factor 1
MEDEFVYSTEEGDLRKKDKGRKKRPSKSDRSNTPPGIKADGTVRVQRESKGRGGKTVSVVYGLPDPGDELKSWAARLKQQCGCGGSVKDGAVIIQGNKVEQIIRILRDAGFTVKQAGG